MPPSNTSSCPPASSPSPASSIPPASAITPLGEIAAAAPFHLRFAGSCLPLHTPPRLPPALTRRSALTSRTTFRYAATRCLHRARAPRTSLPLHIARHFKLRATLFTPTHSHAPRSCARLPPHGAIYKHRACILRWHLPSLSAVSCLFPSCTRSKPLFCPRHAQVRALRSAAHYHPPHCARISTWRINVL